jgi:signal transduction histidine kinase
MPSDFPHQPHAEAAAFIAFAVTAPLFAWCLFRAARSVPSFLLSMLLGCIAIWNLFEGIWWESHPPGPNEHLEWIRLQFIGVAFAPAVGFHYAMSLAGPWKIRPYAVTVVYSGSLVFLTIALIGFVDRFEDLFKSAWYSWSFLIFFTPVAVWTFVLLEQSRRKAQDPGARSLFAYPLLAALIMIPLGFTELALTTWKPSFPRFASVGAAIGSIVIATGVIRHRDVYDAFAVLRRDSASVLRATVQGVIYLEPDGRVIFCNSVSRELLGLNPRTLAEAGLEIPESGRAVVRRGGRLLELRVAPSEDVFPPGRLLVILQDKTRDYELLQSLASKEALASLGQGAATLAHEIRNPLTAVNSTLDCIVHDAAKGQGPEPQHLDLIRSEVRRLNDLLERTLEFSRPLALIRKPCDLNELARRVIATMGAAAGTSVGFQPAAALPPVQGDPDLLAGVLVNLIRNGLEASGRVLVTTDAPDGAVLLRVSSPGGRLPADVLPHLFEPFYTTKAKGTGLGLALCKKVVTAHDGDIVGKNTGEGVDFEVRLPR